MNSDVSLLDTLYSTANIVNKDRPNVKVMNPYANSQTIQEIKKKKKSKKSKK